MSVPALGAHAEPGAGTGRRRILILCPEPPAPPTWGFALRVYHLARELARRHDVTLLTYDTGDESRDWRHLAELFAVRRVHAPRSMRGKRLGQLRSLISRRSFHLGSLRSPAMQRALDQLTSGGRFDVIQIESSQMSGFDFPAGPLLVLDEHNVEHDLMRRVAAVERSAPRRLYQGVEYRKVRREEVAAWRRADGCTVTSVQDERSVRQSAPATPVRVVPNGVDLEHFAPTNDREDPDSIVFVGSINYRPNTDAVLHFAEQILPRIRRLRPSATLLVVGQGAPEAVRRLDGPEVRIVGAVPDVRPYVGRAAVAAVPLRMGGGTRLKVLEGLAMGKALVSTALGCEGIDVEDGRHLLIADQPEAFARAVVRLMEDAQLRRRLGAAGRELVERRYGWEAAGAELDAFHTELLRAAPASQARAPAVGRAARGPAPPSMSPAMDRQVFTDGSYADIFQPDTAADPFHALYRRKRDDVLGSLTGLPEGSDVLDLGGGMGRIAVPLAARHRVTLCDISERMLEMAAAAAGPAAAPDGHLTLRHLDAGRPLPFPTASFDAAVALDLLVHLPDPVAALRELHRVLRPDGALLVDMTNSNPLWVLRYPRYVGRRPRRWMLTLRGGGVLPEWQSIVRHRRRVEFERMLRESGFEVAQRWRYGPPLVPKWLLRRCAPLGGADSPGHLPTEPGTWEAGPEVAPIPVPVDGIET